jgi:hypothetical protein
MFRRTAYLAIATTAIAAGALIAACGSGSPRSSNSGGDPTQAQIQQEQRDLVRFAGCMTRRRIGGQSAGAGASARATDGPKPRPGTRTALHELPFGEIAWPDFEKLIEHLSSSKATRRFTFRDMAVPVKVRKELTSSRLREGGGSVVYQCKRYQTLQPHDIRDAVDEFVAKKWSRPGNRFAKRFVFCTSFQLSKTGDARASRLASRGVW